VPELPEVEALAAYLDHQLRGRVIEGIEILAVSALKTYSPGPQDLAGRTVSGVARRGKMLVIRTDGPALVLHLARAGWARWKEHGPEGRARPGRGPLALRLRLQGGGVLDLTEAGTQKRLAAYIVERLEDVPAVARLGIDPLDPAFSAAVLGQLLAGSRQQLKGVLTDQSVIAGLGNAYSDEVLHRARMSPFRPAGALTGDEVVSLHRAIVDCVTEAVARADGLAASELKDDKRGAMQVHGRTGHACPVCGDTVRQVAFADRSLQYCPGCQTGGKVLADRRLSKLLK